MLFKDTTKLKEYAEFTGDVQFASVKNTIRIVEEDLLVPVIGRELYKSLHDAYTAAGDENSLTTKHKILLDKCRMLIGAYVLYYYTPKAELRVNDAGARRAETQNEKTAFAYQVTNFRQQKLREAESATESLLSFLEDNKGDYPEWTSSKAFASYRSLFIKTGKEFDEFFTSHSPYRNYWAMRAKMVDVEEQGIRAAFGDELFDALKAKDQDPAGSFTDKEKRVLFMIKKAIANFTVAFALPFLNVRIDAGGITVINKNSGNKDLEMREAADGAAINQIRDSATDAGQKWLDSAIKFLNNNASDFSYWHVEESSEEATINSSLAGSFGLY